MSQESKHEDDLEGLLVGLLGLILVIGVTAAAYYLIAGSAPREMKGINLPGISCIGVFGLFLFLYGLVGVIQGKIVIGWGTTVQVRTTLGGAGAFVAGTSTAIGGLLILAPIAVYFLPELIAVVHPLAALLCGLLAPVLGWISGPLIRALGY
jgi:hypothetical protein